MRVASLLSTCREKGIKIVTAESCTGGLLGAWLTEVPGSSDVYERGFVTYSNAAKEELLGVSPDTLALYGAVSEQTAQQMAQGALRKSHADLAVSITGIAGPGGSESKPEGRVCFGIATRAGIRTETVEFGALGRNVVREEAAKHAVALLSREVDHLSNS